MLNLLKRIVQRFRSADVDETDVEDDECDEISGALRDRIGTPRVNVDGTPMAGRHDIRGRGYGSSGGYGSKY